MRMKEVSWAEKLGAAAAVACTALPACGAESALPSAPMARHPCDPFQPTTPPAAPQAIDGLMGGEEVVRVVCVGEGTTGGGLATLCGPWAALQYPKANVDVITFATPWVRGCVGAAVCTSCVAESCYGCV